MSEANASPALAGTPKLRAADAFEKTLPEIEALSDDDLIAINIDVMGAVFTVTAHLPKIQALRPAMEAAFRDFDFGPFDKLEQYTLALNHAHMLYRSSTTPKGSIAELASGQARLHLRERILRSFARQFSGAATQFEDEVIL